MSEKPLTFIDLFAGIGGFRWALSRKLGLECVYSSEWDPYAAKTYAANYGDTPDPRSISDVPMKDIPDHNILCGGFPCQPFSIAGVSKRNSLGLAHGFRHPTQGTLFFDVKKIIGKKRPDAFILENVKNLKSHDKGRTFKVIEKTLRDELGYDLYTQVVDAKGFVPQHRERVFMVGFREEVGGFKFPKKQGDEKNLADILETRVDSKYTLSDKLWGYLQRYAAKHKAAGNGFGFGLNVPGDTSRTLSARYYKDGSEILIKQRGKNPRRLTPRECARLMGYPEAFKLEACSDTRLYKQFGNSVVMPVIYTIAREVMLKLKEQGVGKQRKEKLVA